MSDIDNGLDKLDRLTRLDIERLGSLIATIDSDPCTRVTLQVFRARILPLLKNIGPDFDVVRWIEELSHPHCRLEVFDGETLVYKLPPLISQLETVSTESSRIFDHIDEYKALRADNPRFASVAMYNALSLLSPDVHLEKEAYEMHKAIAHIFKSEGMTLPPGIEEFINDYEKTVDSTPSKVETAEVKPVSNEGGEMVYEDL